MGFCLYERVFSLVPALSETERSVHTRNRLSDLAFFCFVFVFWFGFVLVFGGFFWLFFVFTFCNSLYYDF